MPAPTGGCDLSTTDRSKPDAESREDGAQRPGPVFAGALTVDGKNVSRVNCQPIGNLPSRK